MDIIKLYFSRQKKKKTNLCDPSAFKEATKTLKISLTTTNFN